MNNRRGVDGYTILGLILGFISVIDLLGYWNLALLRGVYIVYAVGALTGVGMVLVSRRARSTFVEMCKTKPPLLILRLLTAISVFLMNWFVTESMVLHFGAESPYIANTGIHMILAFSVLLSHLTYVGFVQRVKKGPEKPTIIDKLRKR